MRVFPGSSEIGCLSNRAGASFRRARRSSQCRDADQSLSGSCRPGARGAVACIGKPKLNRGTNDHFVGAILENNGHSLQPVRVGLKLHARFVHSPYRIHHSKVDHIVADGYFFYADGIHAGLPIDVDGAIAHGLRRAREAGELGMRAEPCWRTAGHSDDRCAEYGEVLWHRTGPLRQCLGSHVDESFDTIHDSHELAERYVSAFSNSISAISLFFSSYPCTTNRPDEDRQFQPQRSMQHRGICRKREHGRGDQQGRSLFTEER